MSYDINKETFSKIQKFNNNIDELDKHPAKKELKIEKLSSSIFENVSSKKSEEIHSVVSRISSPLAKEKVYSQLSKKLSSTETKGASPHRDDFLREDVSSLDQFKICQKLTPEQKIAVCLMVPEKDRESVMHLAEKLVADFLPEAIVSFVFKLQEAGKDREDYVNGILELTKESSDFEKDNIIFALKDLPANEIKDFVKLIKSFTNGDMSSLIYFFKKIPDIERNGVGNIFLSSLMMNDLDYRSLDWVLRQFSLKTPLLKELENSVEMAKKFYSKETIALERIGILFSILDVPENKRESFIDKILILKNIGISCNSIILNACNKVPPEEIVEIVINAKKCFIEGMRDYDQAQLIRACLNAPLAELPEVVSIAMKFFKNETSPADRANYIEMVAKTPKSERSHLDSISNIKEVKLSPEIISILLKIPQDEREEIVPLLPQLINKELSKESITEFLDLLKQIPKAKDEFLTHAFLLKTEGIYEKDWMKIVSSYAKLHQTVGKDFITNVLKLVSDTKNIPEKIALMEAFARLSDSKGTIFIQNISNFFKFMMKNSEKIEVINDFSKFSEKNGELFAQNSTQFFSSNDRLSEKLEMMEIFCSLSDEMATIFAPNASKFFIGDSSKESKKAIMENFKKLTFEAASALVTNQSNFIKQGSGAKEVAELIEAYSKLSPKAASAFAFNIPKLLSNGIDTTRVIRKFNELTPEVAEFFAMHASEWLNKQMYENEIEKRIDNFTMFSPEIARALFSNVPQIFGKEMSFSDKIKILDIFSRIRDEKFVLTYLKLIKPLMEPSKKIERLGYLNKLWESFDKTTSNLIEDAEPFFKEEMNKYDMNDVLSLIYNMPQTARKEIIRDTLKLCNDKTNWINQMTVLYVMDKTPGPLRSKYLEQAERYFSPNMPWETKLNLYTYLTEHEASKDDPGIQEILHPEMQREQVRDRSKLTPEARDLLDKYKEVSSLQDEEFMDIDLQDFASPLPKTSMFADTDLVLINDDFNGVLPINGIKLSELKKAEEMAQAIFSGVGRIKIANENQQFEKEVQGNIKSLLTRVIGRELIKTVMNNKEISSLTIRQCLPEGNAGFEYYKSEPKKGTWINLPPSERISVFKGHGHIQEDEIKTYTVPLYITLGHELIHASHYPDNLINSEITTSLLHKDYDNLEEQITITGFKKNIELADSLMAEPSFSGKKDPDWRKHLEGWEEEKDEGAYNKESFNAINERNLTAAFADSTKVFYPRFSHEGLSTRKYINLLSGREGLGYAYLFMLQKIQNQLILQRVKAPLVLKKSYYDILSKIKTI